MNVEIISREYNWDSWKRSISRDVSGAGPMKVQYQGYLFVPEFISVTYVWVDERKREEIYVDFSGPRLKKDGTKSLNRGKRRLHNGRSGNWDLLPPWALDFVEENRPWDKERGPDG
jgi:hypothetical protein